MVLVDEHTHSLERRVLVVIGVPKPLARVAVANGAALHHPPTPMATPSGAPLGGGGAQCSYPGGGYGVGAGAASPACSLQPQPLQTPAALQSQQLQQLQAPHT